MARAAAEQAEREKAAAHATEERRVRNALLLHQSHDLRARATAAMSDKALEEPLNVKDAYRDAVDDIVGAVTGGKKGQRRATSHSEASEMIRQNFYPYSDGQHGPLRQEEDAQWEQAGALAEQALREEKTNVGTKARAAGKERSAMRKELAALTDEAQKYGNDSMVTSNLAAARGELQKKSPQYEAIRKKRVEREVQTEDREKKEPNMVVALQAEVARERADDEAWFNRQKEQITALIPKLEAHFSGRILPDEQTLVERIKRLRENVARCDNPKTKGWLSKRAVFLHDLPSAGLEDEYTVPMSELARKRDDFGRDFAEYEGKAHLRRDMRAQGAQHIFKEVLGSADLKFSQAAYRAQYQGESIVQTKKWQNTKSRDEYAQIRSDSLIDRSTWYKRAKKDLQDLVDAQINRVADAWLKRNFGE